MGYLVGGVILPRVSYQSVTSASMVGSLPDGNPSLFSQVYRILNIPEVRVPGHDLVATCPGSSKDDRIGDPLHFAVLQVSCGDGKLLI